MSPLDNSNLGHPFPWIRYWQIQAAGHAPTAKEDFGEDQFLSLPSDYRRTKQETDGHLQTLAELLAYPAVILLGRPGAGKTTELEMAHTQGKATSDGRAVILHHAKELDGDPRSLFEGAEWDRASKKPTRLVLDGADELLMENPKYLHQLAKHLKDKLDETPEGHLQVVLSCRAAEWPEGQLTHLWPQGLCVVARLCQLTREAADAFVKHHLHEQAEAFWKEVWKLKIVFLAVWPHSLAELVQEFRLNEGRLPQSLFNLVRRAALRRCDVHHSETDYDRHLRLRDHDVETDWVYRLAGRAAALTCFSGQHQLSLRPSEASSHAISAEVFRTTPEPQMDHSVRAITQADLDALPRTAMFVRLAGGRICFAHQLFREFMAAAWLSDRGVTVPQLENVFGSRAVDGSWRHFPQLAAIAAWLASSPAQSQWRQFLIANDPAVLLRADAACLPDSDKRDIAKALLDRVVQDRAVDQGWQHRHLRSLACEGLAEILRPYLLNFSGANEAARDLAIDIATEANVTAVVPVLWEAIRHPNIKLRRDMAHALGQLTSGSSELEWHQVLDGEIPLDDQGELLGVALTAMVPRRLKVRDVLHHLIPKRDFGVYGHYTQACTAMVEMMEKEDALPVVLHSTNHHASGFGASYERKNDSLLSKALVWISQDLDKPEVMSALVDWWRAAIISYHFKPEWEGDSLTLQQLGFDEPKRRHTFLVAAVNHPKLSYIKSEDFFWASFFDLIRLPEDLEWLAQKLTGAESREERIWAGWLRRCFFEPDLAASHRDVLLLAHQTSGALRALLPPTGDAQDVFEMWQVKRSQSQVEDRKQTKKMQRQEARWEQEHREHVAFCYTKARELYDAGDWRSWDWLATGLSREKRNGGIIEIGNIENIHTKNEAWMLEAARLWLRHVASSFPAQDEQGAMNLGINTTWALYALWNGLKNDHEMTQSVSDRWLPHLFNNMLRFSWQKDDFTVAQCVQHFLPRSIPAIFHVLRHDYTHKGELYCVSHLDCIAAAAVPEMKQMLLEIPPQSEGFFNALGWLARNDAGAAEEVARHWLLGIPEGRTEQSDVVLFASIIVHLQGRLWPELRPRLWNQRETASKTLLVGFVRMSLHLDEKIDHTAWPADYLSDITELMLMTFPPARDPERGGGTVTPRQDLMWVRDRLISAMGDRGMTSAIRRLEMLGLHGTDRWFRSVHLRAVSVKQAAEWRIVDPEDLLAIAGDHDLRLVRDEDDLTNALLLALDNYERDLHTTSHGQALRNDNGSAKREERLSDHLAQWLRENLKLHRIRENQTVHGKREDITVVLNPPGHEPLSLTIEVKKHDSDRLLEKMDSQLMELYLKGQNRSHGIYVVFWFEDGSSPAHPGIEAFEVLNEYLAKQAEELSKPPYRVCSKVIDCRASTMTPSDPHQKGRGPKCAKPRPPKSRRST
jgi:hypothetical protein